MSLSDFDHFNAIDATIHVLGDRFLNPSSLTRNLIQIRSFENMVKLRNGSDDINIVSIHHWTKREKGKYDKKIRQEENRPYTEGLKFGKSCYVRNYLSARVFPKDTDIFIHYICRLDWNTWI